MSAMKLMGRKGKQNGLSSLAGFFVLAALVNIIYFRSHNLEKYQITGQHEHLAVTRGIDVAEHQQVQEKVTVLQVATDVERTQTMALAQFAQETASSLGLDIFAMGGTLLGSMRHHGFIPWDDDMDFYIVLDDWSQVFEIHDAFEERGRAMPHPEFGVIGKTAPNLTPNCFRQKTCNAEKPPHGHKFLGMFRTHFMSSRTVEWSFNYNCTKEDDRWCSRWPSVDIFMLFRENDQLRDIIGWFREKLSVHDVYPLRDILFHGVLFKAPKNPGNFLARHGFEKDLEFGECKGGRHHRGGGNVHFKTNCTLLWDQIPFVRYRKQTENETVEIAYQNDTIVSVLKLNEKGKSTCHATMLSGQRNGCGVSFGH